MQGLSSFLAAYIRQRDISARKFADEADLNHHTVNKLLKPDDKSNYPSVDTLVKIARVTRTDPCKLLEMVIPEDVAPLRTTVEAQILGQQIVELPDEDRSVVDNFLLALRLKKLKKNV